MSLSHDPAGRKIADEEERRVAHFGSGHVALERRFFADVAKQRSHILHAPRRQRIDRPGADRVDSNVLLAKIGRQQVVVGLARRRIDARGRLDSVLAAPVPKKRLTPCAWPRVWDKSRQLHEGTKIPSSFQRELRGFYASRR